MQKNRQIPVDRSESNPMLMGLLELVKEDSQELKKCQQELNKAMEADAEISGLMEKQKASRTELQTSQQKKISEMMLESAAIKELMDQHKKELAELQLRQRQAIEKAMSEEETIVAAVKQQREETNALVLQQQQELNQQLNNNQALEGVVGKVKEARKAMMERQKMFDQEMFKAVYMTPVKITPEPTKDQEGNVKLAEGSQVGIQVLPLNTTEKKGLMMAFTDSKEFQKWEKAGEMHSFSMTMQEFIANVMRDQSLAGVTINPFSANVIIPRERMEMMVKAVMNQRQAQMENQKNVEIVEADINE